MSTDTSVESRPTYRPRGAQNTHDSQESWLYSLNGYDFSFDRMTGENQEYRKPSVWGLARSAYSIKYGKGGNRFGADFRIPETQMELSEIAWFFYPDLELLCICQIL